jgi:hypothetical protein
MNLWPKDLAAHWRKLLAATSGAALTLLLAKFGEGVFDSITNAIGKILLLQILAVAIVSSSYLGWLVYKHGKAKPEQIRICKGVEFRKNPITAWQWMPFCPKCHTAIYPKRYEGGGFQCSAGCGWRSPISGDEIWKILNPPNGQNDAAD